MSECSCRNKIYCALFWLGLFILLPSSFAQNLPVATFDQLIVDKGLSHIYVTAVGKSPQGFIRIGTLYGLHRFDYHNFKTFLYDPDESNSINSNHIAFLEIKTEYFFSENSFD